MGNHELSEKCHVPDSNYYIGNLKLMHNISLFQATYDCLDRDTLTSTMISADMKNLLKVFKFIMSRNVKRLSFKNLT